MKYYFCDNCIDFDEKNLKQKNKLRCLFLCEKLQEYQIQKAHKVNALSGDPRIISHGEETFFNN